MSRTPNRQNAIDVVNGWGQRMEDWVHDLNRPLIRSRKQALKADLAQASTELLDVVSFLQEQWPLEPSEPISLTNRPVELTWPIEGRTPSRAQVSPGGWSWDHVARQGTAALDIAVVQVPIVSMHDGVVAFAGWEDIPGQTIRIYQERDGHAYLSGHCHLSTIEVVTGQLVTAGQRIAISGNTGFTIPAGAYHWHGWLEIDGVRQRLEDIYGIV